MKKMGREKEEKGKRLRKEKGRKRKRRGGREEEGRERGQAGHLAEGWSHFWQKWSPH